MNDMHMRADLSRGYPGRTYRFYTGKVVFEFGYGLSYSNFSYRFLSTPKMIKLSASTAETYISKEPQYAMKDGLDALNLKVEDISSCDAVRLHVEVSVVNNGDTDGSHAVLLFWSPKTRGEGFPRKQLIGFERVHTRARGETEVQILVEPCKHLSIADANGKRVVPLGAHAITIGDLEHEFIIEA